MPVNACTTAWASSLRHLTVYDGASVSSTLVHAGVSYSGAALTPTAECIYWGVHVLVSGCARPASPA
jgi:hypothetical protein